MSTEDLLEFVTARLAEIEAHARKDLHLIERATPAELWTVAYGYNLPYSLLGEDGSIGRITSSRGLPLADGERDLHQSDAMLVGRLVRRAAREATRTLRDVEAKRRLLELWRSASGSRRDLPAGVVDGRDPDERDRDDAVATELDEVLRLLALPFADHPGYDPSWSPADD